MATITVHLDSYASEQEAQDIYEAFVALETTDIEIRRDYERKAGADGLLPWTIILIVPFTLIAQGFFTQIGKNAADRAYPAIEREVGQRIKQLFEKMRDARNRRYGMEIPGSILIEDTISGVTIVADPGLSDAAYYALSQLDLSSFGPNYVRYDSEKQQWHTY